MHSFLPLLLVAAAPSPAPSPTSPDLGHDLGQDSGDLFRRVTEVLSERYYDEEFRPRIDELAAAYLERAEAAGSLSEERAVVGEFLARVPVSHLGLISERAYASLFSELQREERWMYGFQLVRLPQGWFVDWVYEGGPADRAGLRRGDQVLRLNDVAPERSGLLDWRTDDAALPDPPLHALMAEPEDVVEIVLRRETGRVGRLRLPAGVYSGWEACRASARVIEVGPYRVGFVHYWFVPMSDATRFLRELCTERFADCDALVLDLRGRGGAAHQAFGMLAVLDREEGDWRKPLVALVHADSRSAKEVIAYELQSRGDARIVGERTHGAVIPATFQKVGQGAVLMFPSTSLGRYTDAIEGRGIVPDVEVAYPLAWTAGADPILEAGLIAARDWCDSLAGEER